jgi:hypothetical protein
MKTPVIRKVVCIFGKFNNKSDFVLEPVCNDDCKCEECKDAFYITQCEPLKLKSIRKGRQIFRK